MAELIPGTTPAGVLALIQTNWLVRQFMDALRPHSYYRNDARRKRLEPHSGQTATYSKLGNFTVDLAPMPTALGVPDVATFSTEQYTSKPQHFSRSFALDGPTAYVEAGDLAEQGSQKLGEWAGRTQGRIARGALYSAYAGGIAITRRQQVATETILLLNTLSGFRFANSASGLVPVSSTTPLDITINGVANTVTGVTPINTLYPNGPGIITLGTALAGTVAAQSIVKALNGPFLMRAAARTSTETLTTADIPTVQDLLTMRARLSDNSVPVHDDGTYHLHCDASFMLLISKDTQWTSATQGMGPSEAFGGTPGGQYLPLLRLTIFESPDSPALARGLEVAVGSTTGGPGGTTGVEPSGAAGAPVSSKSMQDVGIDTKNSSGVAIRRAIMTGKQLLIETYVDIMEYWGTAGVRKLADITDNVAQYQAGSQIFIAGEVDGWVMSWLPATDVRQLVNTMNVQATFDYVPDTDLTSDSGGDNGTALNQRVPMKRAAVLEYSFAFA